MVDHDRIDHSYGYVNRKSTEHAHALSVTDMVPRNGHADGHISFNYLQYKPRTIYDKIDKDQGFARIDKAWQNREKFNLAFVLRLYDLGQPCSI